MPHRPSYRKMLVITAFAAAAAIALFAWCVSVRRPASAPDAPPASETPADEGARLMAPSEPGQALYTDSRLGFFLTYPEEITPLTLSGEMTVLGYIPVCDPDHAVVCFPYGKERYAGTNFGSAAFSVNLREDLGEGACGAPQPGETPDGAMSVGGTVFTAFSYADAAASHRLDGRSLRAWRDRGCVELSTRIESTVFEVWEPGSIRAFTPADKADIQAVLEKIMASFRFQENLELL